MSISTLSPNSTFREWLTTTNTIIDTLNTSTLVAGQTVNGTFTIGSDSTSSLTVAGALLVNTQSVTVSTPSTLAGNVSISSAAETFTVATSGNTILTSVNSTVVNSNAFVVRSNAEFIRAVSFASTVQMTGTMLTVNTASVTNATIGTARITDATIGTLTLTGSLIYSNSFAVGGSTTISNSLSIAQNTTIGGTLYVGGATTLNSSLLVNGLTTFTRLAVANITSALTCDSTLRVAGTLTALGSMSVSSALSTGSTFSASGATSLNNTLSVSGTTTLGSALNVSGTATFSNAVNINGACAVSGAITSPSPATFGSSLSAGSLAASSMSIINNASVGGALTIGSTATSGLGGTCRIALSETSTYIQAGVNASTGSVANIIFSPIGVAGTEWMRIQGYTGFVGIGTSAPTHRLTVIGNMFLGGALDIQRSISFNWQTKAVNTAYYTDCDGFIVVVANNIAAGGNNLRFTCYSDPTNVPVPVTPRGYLMLDQTTGPRYNSMTIPVQADHRWSVGFTSADSPAAPAANLVYAVYYVPFGRTGASL